jgi:hypothetical protein
MIEERKLHFFDVNTPSCLLLVVAFGVCILLSSLCKSYVSSLFLRALLCVCTLFLPLSIPHFLLSFSCCFLSFLLFFLGNSRFLHRFLLQFCPHT